MTARLDSPPCALGAQQGNVAAIPPARVPGSFYEEM
jgi:hypothetical protein